MTRRRARGRIEGRPGPTGGPGGPQGGLVAPRHAVEAVRMKQAAGLLEAVRERDCDDPRCPEDSHVEYLCTNCTARDGFPRYHLEPETTTE